MRQIISFDFHHIPKLSIGFNVIQELFNIIVEFPESMSALTDLQNCLEKTDLRTKLVQSLRSAFENRLLHPGE